MTSHSNNNPLIQKGWVRVLVFIFFYFSVLLTVGVTIAIISKIGPTVDPSKLPPTIMYLIFLVNAIVSIIIVWVFRKVIDRKSIIHLGLHFTAKDHISHAAVGFFIAILMLCIGTLSLFFTKNLQWLAVHFNATSMFISVGLMLTVAFYEEIVFRGYILNNLLCSVNKWTALIISAAIFTLAHSSNPDFSIVAAINIFLAGLLLGLNYIYTQNLWFSICLHFSWNFFQGPILGYEVSGLNLQSLLQHQLTGNPLITGGNFGFEGSIITTLLLMCAIISIAMVYHSNFSSKKI